MNDLLGAEIHVGDSVAVATKARLKVTRRSRYGGSWEQINNVLAQRVGTVARLTDKRVEVRFTGDEYTHNETVTARQVLVL